MNLKIILTCDLWILGYDVILIFIDFGGMYLRQLHYSLNLFYIIEFAKLVVNVEEALLDCNCDL